jgi:hypothetical protein
MKTLAFLLTMSFYVLGYSQNPDDILGKYHLPNKLDVEIYKVQDKYYGRVIALNNWENGKTTDYKNPDESKRDEPLIGKAIIQDLVFNPEDNEWVNGSMYGPEKGLFFDLKITEVHKDRITVVGSKYLFWKTLVWEKI